MPASWISCADRLPENGQRVLGVVPGNEVLLPGKASFERREVLVLRFLENFFAAQPDKVDAHGRHFWSGEGASNQYFGAVTHWMPMRTPATDDSARLKDDAFDLDELSCNAEEDVFIHAHRKV